MPLPTRGTPLFLLALAACSPRTIDENEFYPDESPWRTGAHDEALRPQGGEVVWHENGVVKREGVWADGHRIGLWRWWGEGAVLEREGRYEDGRREGEWVEWHATGAEAFRGTYRAGRLEGVATWRWPSGVVKRRATHHGGLEEGAVEFFDEDGAPWAQEMRRSGRLEPGGEGG